MTAKTPKLIGYHGNNSENLLRHLGENADFCRLIRKGAVVILVISGATGPIFIKFAQYCRVLSLNFFNQNCHIPIRFGTPACRMKVILPITPKIGCHGNVP